MKIILNILTLGLFALFTKGKNAKSSVKKKVYRENGILKKEVERNVDYDETVVDPSDLKDID